jgi:hypothetical protein
LSNKITTCRELVASPAIEPSWHVEGPHEIRVKANKADSKVAFVRIEERGVMEFLAV